MTQPGPHCRYEVSRRWRKFTKKWGKKTGYKMEKRVRDLGKREGDLWHNEITLTEPLKCERERKWSKRAKERK